jgi:hypothetical protein
MAGLTDIFNVSLPVFIFYSVMKRRNRWCFGQAGNWGEFLHRTHVQLVKVAFSCFKMHSCKCDLTYMLQNMVLYSDVFG